MTATINRLSEETRALARQALEGTWGRALVDLPLTLDDRSDLAELSPAMRRAYGIKLIAEQAPVRILPDERIVGATTLHACTKHMLPIYEDGKLAYPSVSHLTPAFDEVLKVGYHGLRQQVEWRLARGRLDEQGEDLLRAMHLCLEAVEIWHGRYLAELDACIANSEGEEQRHYRQVRAALARVPEHPPVTFHEAVQALWFTFAFQRLCGNWPGIGRIDEMLGPYLQRDLAEGRITLDEARELVAHFWVRGCDWVGIGYEKGSGDAQYYQNIVLSGVDVDGNDLTNEVTGLVLDVVEELRISEFPIAVRISARTPDWLLRRIAEVQRLGGGIVAVYNEDLIIRALVRFGYHEREARCFANDGCWEILIPGETKFSYYPIDLLLLLQEAMGLTDDSTPPDYPDFDSLYSVFRSRLAARVRAFHEEADSFALDWGDEPLMSLLVKDCIELGRSLNNRGARYTVRAPHAGGLADTGNSLLAVKKLVFEEKRLSYPELVECVRANWEGQEELRRQVLHGLDRYGNDVAEADAMTKRVFDDFLAQVVLVRERNGVLRPPGVSTFGREIGWREQRTATPDGHRRGDILATNFSPSPGTDTEGPTAVLRSHCGMDLERLPNGTALELKIVPSSVEGETGIEALVGLMKAFVALGGFFMHIDVVSSEMLREAQQHPEQHANLAVRISGWSARFVTLSEEWQEMIIGRTEQAMR
ncbi:MAG: pyruvate formate lyase family protein [Armatimonadota bacterium]